MNSINHVQGIITKFGNDTYILTWVDAFLLDRKARNLSSGTLDFYRKKMKLFTGYCDPRLISDITQITPAIIREYLNYLEETGHNPGGRHAAYRALKAFLRWWEDELEPEVWKNPINRVQSPHVQLDPLEPLKMDDLSAMVDTCKRHTFTGDRDMAILLVLLDTGARASEFLNIKISDINLATGEILIRQGKGRKPRLVFLGQKSRKALRTYLKHRQDETPALWITKENMPLKYSGLRQLIKRRAKMAGIPAPTLHSFRRAFALGCLRNGMDIYSLKSIMGHSDLQVLQRYLKLVSEDIQEAHRRGSPVDNSNL